MKKLYAVDYNQADDIKGFDVRDNLEQALAIYQEKQNRLGSGTLIRLFSSESILYPQATGLEMMQYTKLYHDDDSWETDWEELASTTVKSPDKEALYRVAAGLFDAPSDVKSLEDDEYVRGMAEVMADFLGEDKYDVVENIRAHVKKPVDHKKLAREWIEHNGVFLLDDHEEDIARWASEDHDVELESTDLAAVINLIEAAKVTITF